MNSISKYVHVRYDRSARLLSRLSIGESFEDPVIGVRVTFQSILCPEQQIATINLDYCPDSWSHPDEQCDPVHSEEAVAVTRCGIPCQNWASNFPHSHDYNDVGNHSFCRNPDNEPASWCYTTSTGTRWDFCDVCGETTDCSFEPPSPPRSRCDLCTDAVVDGSDYEGKMIHVCI